MACLFLVNDIAWASPPDYTSSNSTLAVQSRLKPFFETHGLDLNFKDMYAVACIAKELKNLVVAKKNLRQSHVAKFNKRFPAGEVKIGPEIKTGLLKCTNREYKYAVFNFKTGNTVTTIHALFLDNLTDAERAELRIKDEEKRHLDCPGLEGVWFINPSARTAAPAEPEVRRGLAAESGGPPAEKEPQVTAPQAAAVGAKRTTETATPIEPIKYRRLEIALTNYCPANCDMCLMNATSARSSETSLSERELNTILGYIREKSFEEIEISGGEPITQLNKVLLLVRAAGVTSINIESNGFFAKTKEEVRRILDLLVGALNSNERRPMLKLTISADRFHAKSISPENYLNIIEVLDEDAGRRYGSISLCLKGILTGKDPIPGILNKLGAKLGLMQRLNPFSIKRVVLISGFSFSVIYGALKFIGRGYYLEGKVRKWLKLFPALVRFGLKHYAYKIGGDENAADLWISFDGYIYVARDWIRAMPLANIRESDFASRAEAVLKTDPMLVALREGGVSFLFREVDKLAPDVLGQLIDTCDPATLIKAIQSNRELKESLYPRLRLLLKKNRPSGRLFARASAPPAQVEAPKTPAPSAPEAAVAKPVSDEPLFGIFFRQERIGYRGRPFKCWKFRTMKDGKITRVGKFLRKYGIDELPQVYNMIKREMSIFGPRPKVAGRDEMDQEYIDKILSVRSPGWLGIMSAILGPDKGKGTWSFEKEKALELYEIEQLSKGFWSNISWKARLVWMTFLCTFFNRKMTVDEAYDKFIKPSAAPEPSSQSVDKLMSAWSRWRLIFKFVPFGRSTWRDKLRTICQQLTEICKTSVSASDRLMTLAKEASGYKKTFLLGIIAGLDSPRQNRLRYCLSEPEDVTRIIIDLMEGVEVFTAPKIADAFMSLPREERVEPDLTRKRVIERVRQYLYIGTKERSRFPMSTLVKYRTVVEILEKGPKGERQFVLTEKGQRLVDRVRENQGSTRPPSAEKSAPAPSAEPLVRQSLTTEGGGRDLATESGGPAAIYHPTIKLHDTAEGVSPDDETKLDLKAVKPDAPAEPEVRQGLAAESGGRGLVTENDGQGLTTEGGGPVGGVMTLEVEAEFARNATPKQIKDLVNELAKLGPLEERAPNIRSALAQDPERSKIFEKELVSARKKFPYSGVHSGSSSRRNVAVPVKSDEDRKAASVFVAISKLLHEITFELKGPGGTVQGLTMWRIIELMNKEGLALDSDRMASAARIKELCLALGKTLNDEPSKKKFVKMVQGMRGNVLEEEEILEIPGKIKELLNPILLNAERAMDMENTGRALSDLINGCREGIEKIAEYLRMSFVWPTGAAATAKAEAAPDVSISTVANPQADYTAAIPVLISLLGRQTDEWAVYNLALVLFKVAKANPQADYTAAIPVLFNQLGKQPSRGWAVHYLGEALKEIAKTNLQAYYARAIPIFHGLNWQDAFDKNGKAALALLVAFSQLLGLPHCLVAKQQIPVVMAIRRFLIASGPIDEAMRAHIEQLNDRLRTSGEKGVLIYPGVKTAIYVRLAVSLSQAFSNLRAIGDEDTKINLGIIYKRANQAECPIITDDERKFAGAYLHNLIAEILRDELDYAGLPPVGVKVHGASSSIPRDHSVIGIAARSGSYFIRRSVCLVVSCMKSSNNLIRTLEGLVTLGVLDRGGVNRCEWTLEGRIYDDVKYIILSILALREWWLPLGIKQFVLHNKDFYFLLFSHGGGALERPNQKERDIDFSFDRTDFLGGINRILSDAQIFQLLGHLYFNNKKAFGEFKEKIDAMASSIKIRPEFYNKLRPDFVKQFGENSEEIKIMDGTFRQKEVSLKELLKLRWANEPNEGPVLLAGTTYGPRYERPSQDYYACYMGWEMIKKDDKNREALVSGISVALGDALRGINVKRDFIKLESDDANEELGLQPPPAGGATLMSTIGGLDLSPLKEAWKEYGPGVILGPVLAGYGLFSWSAPLVAAGFIIFSGAVLSKMLRQHSFAFSGISGGGVISEPVRLKGPAASSGGKARRAASKGPSLKLHETSKTDVLSLFMQELKDDAQFEIVAVALAKKIVGNPAIVDRLAPLIAEEVIENRVDKNTALKLAWRIDNCIKEAIKKHYNLAIKIGDSIDKIALSRLNEKELGVIVIANMGSEFMHNLRSHISLLISKKNELPGSEWQDKARVVIDTISKERRSFKWEYADRDGRSGFLDPQKAALSIEEKVRYFKGLLVRIRELQKIIRQSQGSLSPLISLTDLIENGIVGFIETAATGNAPQREPEPVNIIKILKPPVEAFTRPPERRRYEITLDTGDQEFFVKADPVQLQQVFLNIINNAEYAVLSQRGYGSKICLKAEQDNNNVCISITDDGAGIPAEAIGRVFEPYFTTKSTGTGLGLSFAKRVINSYGGTISVESELGKGTTFTIRLPMAQPQPAASPTADRAAPATEDSAGRPSDTSLKTPLNIPQDVRDAIGAVVIEIKRQNPRTRITSFYLAKHYPRLMEAAKAFVNMREIEGMIRTQNSAVEKSIIDEVVDAMEKSGGDRKKAAQALGWEPKRFDASFKLACKGSYALNRFLERKAGKDRSDRARARIKARKAKAPPAPPVGRPAQLLGEMRAAGIFSAEKAKTSKELSGNAVRGGEADSPRTIRREIHVLYRGLELLKKAGTKYFLAEWLSKLTDSQWTKLLADLGLNKASPTVDDLKVTRKLIRDLKFAVESAAVKGASQRTAKSLCRIKTQFPGISQDKWDHVARAFVRIYGNFHVNKGAQISFRSCGAGCIFSSDDKYYYVVTAAHVLTDISRTERVFIRLDQGNVSAEIVDKGGIILNRDLSMADDIGILRIKKKTLKQPVTPLIELTKDAGNPFPDKDARQDRKVFILGNRPLMREAVHERLLVRVAQASKSKRPGTLEIDKELLPGFSGGPVIDEEGNMIGMATSDYIYLGEAKGISTDIEHIKRFFSESVDMRLIRLRQELSLQRDTRASSASVREGLARIGREAATLREGLADFYRTWQEQIKSRRLVFFDKSYALEKQKEIARVKRKTERLIRDINFALKSDEVAAAFKTFAAKCRAEMQNIRKCVEDGNVKAIEEHIKAVLDEANKEFSGDFRERVRDAMMALAGIELFARAGELKKDVFSWALEEIEAVLGELEKLMAAGRLLDAGKAWVKSGVLDASKVLGAKADNSGAVPGKGTPHAQPAPEAAAQSLEAERVEIRKKSQQALGRPPTNEEFAVIWRAHLTEKEGEQGNLGRPDEDGIYRHSTLSPETRSRKVRVLKESRLFTDEQIKKLGDYGAMGSEQRQESAGPETAATANGPFPKAIEYVNRMVQKYPDGRLKGEEKGIDDRLCRQHPEIMFLWYVYGLADRVFRWVKNGEEVSTSSIRPSFTEYIFQYRNVYGADKTNQRRLAQLFDGLSVVNDKEGLYLYSSDLDVRIRVSKESSKFEFVSLPGTDRSPGGIAPDAAAKAEAGGVSPSDTSLTSPNTMQWQQLENAMRKLSNEKCGCQEMAMGFLKDFYFKLASSREREQLSCIARTLAEKEAIGGHTFFLLEQFFLFLNSIEERRLGFRLALLLAKNDFQLADTCEYLGGCLMYATNEKERLSLITLALELTQNKVEPAITFSSLGDMLPNVTDEKERNSIYSLGFESARRGLDPSYALGELYKDNRKEIAMPLNRDEREIASKVAVELAREGIDAGPAVFSIKIILGKSGNNRKIEDVASNIKSSFLRLRNNLNEKGITSVAVPRILPFMLLRSDGSAESIENICVKTEQDATDIHNNLQRAGIDSTATLESLDDLIEIMGNFEAFPREKLTGILLSVKRLARDGVELNGDRRSTLIDYYLAHPTAHSYKKILQLLKIGTDADLSVTAAAQAEAATAKAEAGGVSQSDMSPRPAVEPTQDIGSIIANNGDRLYMRKGQDRETFSVAFYNGKNERVGFVDVILKAGITGLINFIYTEKDARGKGYAGTMLDAVLVRLKDGSLSGKKVTYLRAYIRNPLLPAMFLRKGFSISSPRELDRSLRTEVIVSRERQTNNKVAIYIADKAKKENVAKYMVENPDWQMFELKDSPIEGDTRVIFAKYVLAQTASAKPTETAATASKAAPATEDSAGRPNGPSPETPLTLTWPYPLVPAENNISGLSVFFANEGSLRNPAALAAMANQKITQDALTPKTKREINRGMEDLSKNLASLKAVLSETEYAEASKVVAHLESLSARDGIRPFTPIFQDENECVFGMISGNERILLAEMFFRFFAGMSHGMPEMLFRAGHRMLFGGSADAIKRCETLAEKIAGKDRMWWLSELKAYPFKLSSQRNLYLSSTLYADKNPGALWVVFGDYIMMSDPSSMRNLEEWLKLDKDRLWIFQHRFLDMLESSYVFTDTVLRFTAQKRGEFLRLIIDDVNHPADIRIEENWIIKPGHEAVSYEDAVIAELPQVTREIGPSITIGQARFDDRGRAGGSIPLRACSPAGPDPIIREKGLFGKVVARYDTVFRPWTVSVSEQDGIYIEPIIGGWYWAHERAFALQYFDFIEELTKLFRGMTRAHLGKDSLRQASPNDSLYAWGAINQNRYWDEKWEENLKKHREDIWEMNIPVFFLKNAVFRKLVLDMAAEGFQQFSLVGGIDETGSKQYKYTCEGIIAALDRARVVKSTLEAQRKMHLRGYIHHSYDFTFSIRKDDVSSEKLYITLLDERGGLVHREELPVDAICLYKLLLPKEIGEEHPIAILPHFPLRSELPILSESLSPQSPAATTAEAGGVSPSDTSLRTPEIIERAGIASRSMDHGGLEVFDIIADSNRIPRNVDIYFIKDNARKEYFKPIFASFKEEFCKIKCNFMDLLNRVSEASRRGTLTADQANEYIDQLQEFLRNIKIQRPKMEKIRDRFISSCGSSGLVKEEEMTETFKSIFERFDNLIEKLQSRVEIATATTTSYSPQIIIDAINNICDRRRKAFGRPDKSLMVENNLPASAQVNANRLTLTNTFQNIIENAIFFAVKKQGDNAKVRIVLTEEKGFARIDVIDNGAGIPKELLEIDAVTGRQRLFNLNVSQREGGTGLGTTEAWYAVKDMGGTISVESEPGKGTTFTIRLPLAQLQPAASAPAESATALSREEKDIISKSKAKEYKSSLRSGAYFNVFGRSSAIRSFDTDSSSDYVPPVEVRDKDVLILPADNDLPLILMEHKPKSIVVADINPVTIAWQKAIFLYGGKEPLQKLLRTEGVDKLKIIRLLRSYVRENEEPVPCHKNIDARIADLTKRLPFADNSFDSIVVRWLFGVPTGIRGREQVAEAFKELLRVARPGAKIMIQPTQPDDYSIFSGSDFDETQTLQPDEFCKLKYGNKAVKESNFPAYFNPALDIMVFEIIPLAPAAAPETAAATAEAGGVSPAIKTPEDRPSDASLRPPLPEEAQILLDTARQVRRELVGERIEERCRAISIELADRLRQRGVEADVYVISSGDHGMIYDAEGNKVIHFWVETPEYLVDAFPEGIGKVLGAQIEKYISDGVVIMPKKKGLGEIYSRGMPVKDTIWSTAEGMLGKPIESDPFLEARGIHDENLEYVPEIKEKTILCHIVANSILPGSQKDVLKRLEQDMRGEEYSEKVVALSGVRADDQAGFMEELQRIKAYLEREYTAQGYKVEFDVACPDKELVGKIQAAGMRALAFARDGEGDIVQPEGIILALRVLRTDSIDNLLRVYKFLTGQDRSAGTNDINELARNILFSLPLRKADVNMIGTLNRLAEENIKQAA